MPADLRALIDRIESALGAEATPERVERVARAVLGTASGAARPAAAPEAAPAAADGFRCVVTAYGHDTPGVLAALTAELAAAGANILDVSQKILQGYFTVVLVADFGAAADLGAIRAQLTERIGSFGGARVLIQHEEIFQAMHRP
jgi:ACT domain-containing protein